MSYKYATLLKRYKYISLCLTIIIVVYAEYEAYSINYVQLTQAEF